MPTPSLRLSALLLALLLLSGCATAPVGPARRDATAALIEHRDFPAVARASRDWVAQALRTITALEAELAAK